MLYEISFVKAGLHNFRGWYPQKPGIVSCRKDNNNLHRDFLDTVDIYSSFCQKYIQQPDKITCFIHNMSY